MWGLAVFLNMVLAKDSDEHILTHHDDYNRSVAIQREESTSEDSEIPPRVLAGECMRSLFNDIQFIPESENSLRDAFLNFFGYLGNSEANRELNDLLFEHEKEIEEYAITYIYGKASCGLEVGAYVPVIMEPGKIFVGD
ncbi:hypothetical protein ENBRE01_3506, partial [Enteropsectra breve]